MNREERDRFIGKLKRWNYEGCSILLVGDALDLLRQTSELLLGADDSERYRILVQTDAEPGSAADRLPEASVLGSTPQAKIFDYESLPRSAGAHAAPTEKQREAVPVRGGLDNLYDELTETMDEFESQSEELPASAIRLSVDTLRPLLQEHDRDAVDHWLAHMGEATKSYRGIGHYILPKSYKSETVQDIAAQFEAVIEVQSYDGEDAPRKERWHVPDGDLTTPWRVMDGDVNWRV